MTQRTGRSCRHFSRLRDVQGGNCCAIGHPIRKIVIAANGGSGFGIGHMFPCVPTPQRKADCPNYDPKTEAEIALNPITYQRRLFYRAWQEECAAWETYKMKADHHD